MTTPHRLVGVIHLPALPGSALGAPATEFDRLLESVQNDARAYDEGGITTLIVENFGDLPFAKDRVPPQTIAAMTRAVLAVREVAAFQIGVNVLRNDVLAAVSIAVCTNAGFVRANVYVGAAVTDQGLIEGRAHEVQALIRQLGANIDVWADVDVKHATQLASRPIAEQARDAVERGLARAVIVSGSGTGQPTALDDLTAVREALPDTPIYVGSGATLSTALELLQIADGLIVGTAVKHDGIVTNPVDPERVRAFGDIASRT